MGEIRNEVLYSEGRRKMLAECPRQYWYDVYRSWGGWWHRNQPPRERAAEEAYWGKNATDLHRYAGQLVHELAAWSLKSALEGKAWEREELRRTLMTAAAGRIDRALSEARGRVGQNPKKSVRFVELENGLPFDEELLREKVRAGLMGLTAMDDSWMGERVRGSNLLLRAMSKPTSIVSIDEKVQYQVLGVPVYMAADLLLRGKDAKSIVIIDWKTGRPREDDRSQVIQYGAWAVSRSWEGVALLLVYLSDRDSVTVDAVEATPSECLERVEAMVQAFLDDLRPRLFARDLARNQPVESKFEPTSDVSACAACRFSAMCKRDGTRPC